MELCSLSVILDRHNRKKTMRLLLLILCTSIPGKVSRCQIPVQKIRLIPYSKIPPNFISITTQANTCCNPKHTHRFPWNKSIDLIQNYYRNPIVLHHATVTLYNQALLGKCSPVKNSQIHTWIHFLPSRCGEPQGGWQRTAETERLGGKRKKAKTMRAACDAETSTDWMAVMDGFDCYCTQWMRSMNEFLDCAIVSLNPTLLAGLTLPPAAPGLRKHRDHRVQREQFQTELTLNIPKPPPLDITPSRSENVPGQCEKNPLVNPLCYLAN